MSKKVKIYAPVFDMPKEILDMGRFNIRFLTIDLIEKDGVTVDVQAADIPSGVILRIIDWNNIDSEEPEVLNISYQFIPKVHVVTSKETGEGFYLFDEARASETIVGLVGDEKVSPIAPNSTIDNDGNVIMECEDEKTDKDDLNLEEILSEADDDNEDDVENCKREDKPHKSFVANRNEQVKKEVQKKPEEISEHDIIQGQKYGKLVSDSAKHMLPDLSRNGNQQNKNTKNIQATPIQKKPENQSINTQPGINFASIVRKAFPSK